MSALNPFITVIIGLFVSIISYFNESLQIFTYVGLAMITYGVMRFFIFPAENKEGEKKKKKQTKKEEKKEINYPSKLCSRCGARLRPFDRYCFYCGVKVR